MFHTRRAAVVAVLGTALLPRRAGAKKKSRAQEHQRCLNALYRWIEELVQAGYPQPTIDKYLAYGEFECDQKYF